MSNLDDVALFLEQNPHSANGLSRDQIEPYATHHAGGLVVLHGYAGTGRHVKMHDTWGPGTENGEEPGDVIVHDYDPDSTDEHDETITYFTDGPTAFEAFLTALGEPTD